MILKQIFEPRLAQYSYLVGSEKTREAILVDPMRDVDRYISIAEEENLKIVGIAETHIHADYLSGAREMAERFGFRIYVANSPDEEWKFNWLINGDYEYKLLNDGDVISVGEVELKALFTPGHTPEHLSFIVSDNSDNTGGILSGDFVFVGDVGRPDLLESAAGMTGAMLSSAKTLYRSLDIFKDLPHSMQVFPGHGAGSACGKSLSPIPVSTVGTELTTNPSILAATSEDNFVNFILDDQPEPPVYFERMKQLNKEGPPLLGKLPDPTLVSVKEIAGLIDHEENLILDTRSWDEFKNAHIPGSIFSPLNSSFNTTAGCYVEPEKRIYLVIQERFLKEAVNDLIRIGLDKIVGYIEPGDLKEYGELGGATSNIKDVNVHELNKMINEGKVNLLDVRRAAELEEIGYLEGAINVAHTVLMKRLSEVPNDKPVAVFCLSGVRAMYASSFLKKRGYEPIIVQDGFKAWISAGYDVAGR